MNWDSGHKILSVIATGLLIYILFLNGCGNKTFTPVCHDTVFDTVRTEVIDTIFTERIAYKDVFVRIPIPYKDTTFITIANVANDPFDDMFFEDDPWIYEDSIQDDTMSIYYRIRSWGAIDLIEIGYRPTNPFYIEKRIESVIIKPVKSLGLYMGLNAGLSTDGLSFLEPNIELVTPKMGYTIGYDMVGQSVIGGVKFRLRLPSRKN